MNTRTSDAPSQAVLVRSLAVVAALVATVTVGGCSGGSESAGGSGDKNVASVNDDSRKQSQAPAEVERPLIRPDTSKEEEWRLVQVHMDCIAQQGVKMYKNDDGSYKGHDSSSTKAKAALEKCRSKEPETLPQRAAREDPEYQDKYERWLKCMRSHGLKVSPAENGFFSFDDGDMGTPEQSKWIKKCEAEAFVQK
jgi:hypothetical protein